MATTKNSEKNLSKDEELDIEKALFPDSGSLKADAEGNLTAIIIDEELDPYDCSFHGDGCVEINTKESNTIVLSVEKLYALINLICEAEERIYSIEETLIEP